MLLSELTPFATILADPEVADAELLAIPIADNIRLRIEALLREKRQPASYNHLLGIGNMVADKIIDGLANTFENHIAKEYSRQRGFTWNALGVTVTTQKDWMLRQVKVEYDEVSVLVNRWLILKFGDAAQGGVMANGRIA